MQKIVITGGKGGTGKSTFAIFLANKFVKNDKKVILVDCDIECPNDHLLLGQKLVKLESKVYVKFPKLDKSKCQKCDLCVSVCQNNAIFRIPKKYPQFLQELCSGCGACGIVCPHKAIKFKPKEIGKIYLNKINKNFYLITGLAKPVLEETSLVVRETKKIAKDFALKVGADYIISDTAAGTHCPVIMALLDNDFIYAVTEPTLMGAYDLDLILDLCQKLEAPVKVVLNQADLGDKRKILPVLKKFKVKIEKEIPYSKKLAEAYSRGRLLNIGFDFIND